MKVLFLHALADPARGAGAEMVVWEQIKGLRKAGHDCALLATSAASGLQRTQHEGVTVWLAGIRNLYWPYDGRTHHPALRSLWHALDSYNPWMQGYLRQVIAKEQPDVISMHNLPGWSVAAWKTAADAGIPAVQVLHDYYLICSKATLYKRGRNCSRQCAGCRAYRLPHRALSNRLGAVVGVSRYVLDRHLQAGYFAQVPVRTVIHNARDPRGLGLDDAPPMQPHTGTRFGYIGRLDPPKGVEVLIEAFRKLRHPDVALWIAGAGKPAYEAHLRAMADGDARIRFLGRVRPAQFYPQIDVCIVPSLWNEPLGMVVAEAFAFGKPVIGARRGGIPELLADSHAGILFDPDQPGELLAALSTIADNAGALDDMSLRARARATPFLDMDTYIRDYLTVLAGRGSNDG